MAAEKEKSGKQLMPHIWEEDGEAIKSIKKLVKN